MIMGLLIAAYDFDCAKRKKGPTSKATDPIVTKMNLTLLMPLYNDIIFSFR